MLIRHSHIELIDDGFDYLGGPYAHPMKHMRRLRFEQLTEAAAILKRVGHVIYSPITQGHIIHERHELPTEWGPFWKRQSLNMLSRASRLIVVMLDGWEVSVGVQAEIEHARELGIDIYYIEEVAHHEA